MGRPPVPPEVARSERVATFVTISELEKLLRIAEDQQKSLSRVVHDILRRALG
jgi:hypothetical protein